MITPSTNRQKPCATIPPMISDTMPSRIVTIQPIGSTPGWKSRPRAPTIAPTMINHTHDMPEVLPDQLLEPRALLRELVVVEQSGAMELLESSGQSRLLEALRVGPELVGVDPKLL